jgi:hypothetical protein
VEGGGRRWKEVEGGGRRDSADLSQEPRANNRMGSWMTFGSW